MTAATAAAPVTRGDVEFILQEHRRLTHFGWGWTKLGASDDWHTARVRLASLEPASNGFAALHRGSPPGHGLPRCPPSRDHSARCDVAR